MNMTTEHVLNLPEDVRIIFTFDHTEKRLFVGNGDMDSEEMSKSELEVFIDALKDIYHRIPFERIKKK